MPGGRRLVTLHDAASYVTELPSKEAALPKWQAAIEVLLLVSRGRSDDDGKDRRDEGAEPRRRNNEIGGMKCLQSRIQGRQPD